MIIINNIKSVIVIFKSIGGQFFSVQELKYPITDRFRSRGRCLPKACLRRLPKLKSSAFWTLARFFLIFFPKEGELWLSRNHGPPH